MSRPRARSLILVILFAPLGSAMAQAPAPAAEPAAALKPAAAGPDTPLAAEQADVYRTRLIEALRSDESFKVRLQAAVFLGRSEDDRAVEPLIAALGSDEHYTVRAAAATALANLNVAKAISHIIRRIATDLDPFVREEATRALQKYDPEEALPYAVATYGSEDAAVRKETISYLVGLNSAGSEPTLMKALGDTPEIFEVVRTHLLKRGKDDVLRFLAMALEHRDASVRTGAVQVLDEMATAEAALLVHKVYDRDIEADAVRAATRRALRHMRQFLPVDQIVKDAVDSPQKHARAKALKLLGVLGGEQAQKVLLGALNDEDAYVRGNAVMAMGELGDPAVVPALEKMEADPANQRIVHLVRHAIAQLRRKQAAAAN
ncbi:MAG: HEAT repeat domain-containing protein [Deltaproteobacteria bacterium]|nr:HEAT repeat domain-containing protein [Deltaproteobacteria bacterium]